MIYQTFAVYDTKAKLFLFPANYRRKEEAIRAFSIACDDPNSDFHKYAEDYSLHHIGEYDDETGLYETFKDKSTLLIITAVNASQKHKAYISQRLTVSDVANDKLSDVA